MIIIKLKGGLGNQLFQYAFGRHITIKIGEELVLDTDVMEIDKNTYRKYGLKYFNIKGRVATPDEVKKYKYPLGIISKILRGIKFKIFKIQNVGWKPKTLNSKQKYLDGYWQSYKYTDPIRKELVEDLTLKNNISESAKKIENEILNTNSISLHIRRGDYAANKKTNQFHGLCSMEYYKKAVKYITDKNSNCIFYIFSDDIEWVKNNLDIENDVVYVSNNSIKDYEELYLMSQCKHNIIANSSFSWWGAWLNNNPDKVVIAPKKWDNSGKSNDIVPDSWIKF